MSNFPHRSEASSRRREFPASEEALVRTATALEGFRFVGSARDVTAQEVYDAVDVPPEDVPKDVSEDVPGDPQTSWPDDLIVGRQWEQSDQDSSVKVLVYDRERRNKLGELFAQERATMPHFHLHGQLNFHKALENSYFSGVIYFLGDGDKIEEIEVFSAYAQAQSTDTGFAMMQFSQSVGLSKLVHEAQSQPELPEVRHRIRVQKGMAEDIAQAMESLRIAAASGT